MWQDLQILSLNLPIFFTWWPYCLLLPRSKLWHFVAKFYGCIKFLKLLRDYRVTIPSTRPSMISPNVMVGRDDHWYSGGRDGHAMVSLLSNGNIANDAKGKWFIDPWWGKNIHIFFEYFRDMSFQVCKDCVKKHDHAHLSNKRE